MYKKIFFTLIFLLLLVSCSQPVEVATPVPTPVFWQVFLSPTLDGFRDDLQTCMAESNVKMILDEGYHYKEGQDYSLVLLWGDSAVSGEAYVLMQDYVRLVVNTENPLQEISISEMLDIYSGNIKTWEQVNPALSDLGEISLWVFPPGVDLENEQVKTTIPFEEIRPDANIAPNAAVMLEAIQDNKNGMGLLPGVWIDESVKQINIIGIEEDQEIPIILLMPAEVKEKYSNVLSCFQNKVNQKP